MIEGNSMSRSTKKRLSAFAAAAGAVLCLALLWMIERDCRAGMYFCKPSASLMFVIVAACADSREKYPRFVLIALVWGMIGDVFLMFPARWHFLAGLSAFLVGHLFYLRAFHEILPIRFSNLPLWATAGLIAVGVAVVASLWPLLGDLHTPVVLYASVLSLMLWCACGVAARLDSQRKRCRMILLGAICFYVSDLAVALRHFAGDESAYLWGLPLYYLAQFLFAFSALQADAPEGEASG